MNDTERLRAQIRVALRGVVPAQHARSLDTIKTAAIGDPALSVDSCDGLRVARGAPTRVKRQSKPLVNVSHANRVHAIWTLPEANIESLLARYSPSRETRTRNIAKVARRIASHYKTGAVKQRARLITLSMLQGQGSAAELRTLFGMDGAAWRSSRHRKMRTEIAQRLAETDRESLELWHIALEDSDAGY